MAIGTELYYTLDCDSFVRDEDIDKASLDELKAFAKGFKLDINFDDTLDNIKGSVKTEYKKKITPSTSGDE